MSAGQSGWAEPARGRLYRDVAGGRIAGVCAGIARYLQVKPKFVRIGVILLGIFVLPSLVPLLIGYVALAVFLPVAPGWQAAPAAGFTGTGGAAPVDPLSALSARLRSLDRRLADMETHVTSNEFALRQKFREL